MEVRRTIVFGDGRPAPAEPQAVAQIPPAVLSHPDLSFGAKVLFAALHAHAWPEAECTPSQEELARDVSCTVRQVQRLLLQLRRAGFVTWKRRGLNRPNLYRLSPDGRPLDPTAADHAVPPATTPSSPEATHWSEGELSALAPK